MIQVPKTLIFWIAVLLMAIGYSWITYAMLAGKVFSDFPAHLDIWNFYQERGKIPFPPLYYLSFFGISTLIPSPQSLKIGLLILVSLSWLGKFLLTYRYLSPVFGARSWTPWIPLGLILFFPISAWMGEGAYWFLGKMTPNLWHNGSTIFVFPFCMLLFGEVQKWFSGEKPNFFRIGLWTLLILGIKPNFLFGLIPALISLIFLSEVGQKSILPIIIYSGTVLLFLLGSKWMIFSNSSEQSLFFNFNARGDVILDPFGVWLQLSENPFWDLFGSFPFLMGSLACFGRTLGNDSVFRLAFSTFCFAMLVFFLFAESGPGYLDGNFYWQIPISLFILYLVIAKILWSTFSQNPDKKPSDRLKMQLLSFLFALHVFSGLAYLWRITETGQYF
ncbi:hypothetical protein [Algoriphagus confluentis]|uniref:Uncharacterized protein n=1 Tax=Algoriphagus confluentis TaxID=1697556 RepID=A0ABQ6PPE7_9BACT|nr:hypothetical protein Aconfl_21940 [Algoriphagus confluentis]